MSSDSIGPAFDQLYRASYRRMLAKGIVVCAPHGRRHGRHDNNDDNDDDAAILVLQRTSTDSAAPPAPPHQ
ncbi:hypothetical protein [Streptomyces longisporoflavus]|uniref:Uncharacterized protein n=1 Tax=Streptomyces longisporoflavus TaxID=28044 RepID=A0ABW7R2Z5_9ACTN